MITLERAQELAWEKIEKSWRKSKDDKLVIFETVEFDEGWLFSFTTKKCLETKNLRYAPIGLGPVIVGKENGETYQTRTGISNEMRIRQFKEH